MLIIFSKPLIFEKNHINNKNKIKIRLQLEIGLGNSFNENIISIINNQKIYLLNN